MKGFFVGGEAFLPHPCGMRGHYIRTHPCVLFVECPYCGAKVGQCCLGHSGRPRGSTHVKRRSAYTKNFAKIPLAGSVTLEV